MEQGIFMSFNDPRWNNRDGNGERGGNGNRGDNQGPPDLEEIWQDFNQRLSSLFGKRRGGGGPSGPGRDAPPGFSSNLFGSGLFILLLLIVTIWLCSGIYTVNANERGVVLRLGRFVGLTQPGLNWRLPAPIGSHVIVDLTGVRTVMGGIRGNERSRTLMITDDANIVSIQFAVQYVLNDPEKYVFNNVFNNDRSEDAVALVAESAMREIVGKSTMDFVLYEGREQIAATAQELIQEILDRYSAGIQVSRVTLQDAQAPEQVQAAFDDAIKARQDLERLKNEGEAYARDVIPRAQGTSARLRAQAEGYRARVIANAEGEAARFEQLLTEFRRAPEVTRERLYIETMQQILSKSSKLMIDAKGGGNVLLLPLDKLAQQATPPRTAQQSGAASTDLPFSTTTPAPVPFAQIDPRDRDALRSRQRGER
jgi:membrane protease subunit HflK